MDYRQIEYFLAVSRCSSISAAARKLAISQQALSKTIHGLEAELQCELFERSVKGIRLTHAGIILKSIMQPVYLSFQAACVNTPEALLSDRITDQNKFADR